VLDALAWEPTTVHAITPGPTGLLLDPDVSAGSLADLARPGTVAVSSDATFDTGFRLGATVPLRWPDGTTTTPVVVAVYERGLGFGDYLVGPGTLDAEAPASVLVDGVDGAPAAIGALGLDAVSPASYAQDATAAGAAERRVSSVLLLALLAFVLLGAANTLVMVTGRRRAEIRLYRRTGATSAQLVRMAVVESLLTGGVAWAIGTLAVLPAILGVGLGLLGPVVPPVDLRAYGALSLAVLALPLLTVVPTVARLARRS
jgi:putative ABC transport system permease protein